jgi:aminocarboxymuconate-semialdehyde decarboxylase
MVEPEEPIADPIAGKVIDLHSHLYPPRYMDLLRGRSEAPRVIERGAKEYLAVLPGRDDRADAGRLIDPSYWSTEAKIAFMDRSGIDVSVVSPPNPWLYFLPADQAIEMARLLNQDLEQMARASGGRLFALGVLPTTADAAACVAELERIAALAHLRGIILSTHGLGKGLDDPALEPVWVALCAHDLTVFVHPHSGIGQEHYAAYGYVLYLALGFTFETTIEAAKMALAGVLQRHAGLKLLLAHGGGTIPFLAGRIEACLAHDEVLDAEQRAPAPQAALRGAIYDAVTYSAQALCLVVDFAGRDKVVFGTDHPFSISEAATILGTIDELAESDVVGPEPEEKARLRAQLRGDNAARLLSLPRSA